MSSSKKGNQWYFGMKAHVGVDAESGLVQFPHKPMEHLCPGALV
jgi:hypothetical protein